VAQHVVGALGALGFAAAVALAICHESPASESISLSNANGEYGSADASILPGLAQSDSAPGDSKADF
jgi:hypothetical protein